MGNIGLHRAPLTIPRGVTGEAVAYKGPLRGSCDRELSYDPRSHSQGVAAGAPGIVLGLMAARTGLRRECALKAGPGRHGLARERKWPMPISC